MKITFQGDKWKIYDLVNAMYFSYNKNYDELLLQYNLKPNTNISRALKLLSKTIDHDKKFLNLFFNENFLYPSLPCYVDDLWPVQSIETLSEFFLNTDKEKIIKSVIKNLYEDFYTKGNKDSNFKKELEELSHDNAKLFSFIDNLQIDVDQKWEVFSFINNPEKYYEEFSETLKKFIPRYKKFIEKHEDEMKEFNNFIKNNIENKGIDFLKSIVDDFIEIDSYKNIYVTTSLINSVSTNYEIYGNNIYLTIGTEYEKILEHLGESEELEKSLNILKTLSEPVKFEILNDMKDKPLFGKEIAEKLGLNKATVSYHMNGLTVMKLIKLTKEGTKIYYSLNKDTLINSLDFIKKHFEEK